MHSHAGRKMEEQSISNEDGLKRILYFRHVQPIVANQCGIAGLNKELNTLLKLGVL